MTAEPSGSQDRSVEVSVVLPKVVVGSLLLFVVSLGFVYVSVSYFGANDLASLLSFKAHDIPRPMPLDAYFEPIGVHYFGDFMLSLRTSSVNSPYGAVGFVPFGYLPGSAVLVSPFLLLNGQLSYVAYLLCCGFIFVIAIARLSKHLSINDRLLVGLLIVFSGPFISAIDRGNFSLLMAGLAALAVAELSRGHMSRSALLFGIVASFKLYPILLLIIFVRRSRLRDLAAGASSFLLFTFAPLFFYRGGPLVNLRELLTQFANSADGEHAVNVHAFNNSFYSLLTFIEKSNFLGLRALSNVISSNYTVVGLALALCVVGVLVFVESDDATRFTAVAILMVFLPQTVGQYVLLLLLVPILHLVGTSDSISRWNIFYLSVLAFFLVPKNFPLGKPSTTLFSSETSFASVLNPLMALGLLALIVLRLICTAGVARIRPRRGLGKVTNQNAQGVTSFT